MRGRIGPVLMALALLAGCSGEPELLNLASSNDGPDEFGILPTKPLQEPESYASLPPPTPGGSNITDPTPEADAAAALGGRVTGGGIRDRALIARTTRFGVDDDIRRKLALEDRAFRRENNGRLLERIFDVNTYFDAYSVQELDQYRALERFRRAGVRTPAAPPEGAAR